MIMGALGLKLVSRAPRDLVVLVHLVDSALDHDVLELRRVILIVLLHSLDVLKHLVDLNGNVGILFTRRVLLILLASCVLSQPRIRLEPLVHALLESRSQIESVHFFPAASRFNVLFVEVLVSPLLKS